MESAVQRWGRQLGEWAIPQEIIDAAPEQPWTFPTDLFARAAAAAAAPDAPRGSSHHRAREALGAGGGVLDVGVGGGAASLPLAPPATHVTGVDSGAELLGVFDTAATDLGVEHTTVLGRWPDVAPEASAADVVVCHHVLYNVADLEPFVAALNDHARRRVVIELTAEHPTARFDQPAPPRPTMRRCRDPTPSSSALRPHCRRRRRTWRRPPAARRLPRVRAAPPWHHRATAHPPSPAPANIWAPSRRDRAVIAL